MLIPNFSEKGTLECRILTISRAQAKQIKNRKTSIDDFKDFFTAKNVSIGQPELCRLEICNYELQELEEFYLQPSEKSFEAAKERNKFIQARAD